jgi:hypothetical protein
MNDEERLKAYQGFAETSRKWISVLDAKAGFISAMSAALVGFIWTGASLGVEQGWAKWLGVGGTAFAFVALATALLIVLPKISVSSVFGKNTNYEKDYGPVSFYGHVAAKYPPEKWPNYLSCVESMDQHSLAVEALEQHFTVSHVLKNKSERLTLAGAFLLLALAMTGLALMIKELHQWKQPIKNTAMSPAIHASATS